MNKQAIVSEITNLQLQHIGIAYKRNEDESLRIVSKRYTQEASAKHAVSYHRFLQNAYRTYIYNFTTGKLLQLQREEVVGKYPAYVNRWIEVSE